MAHVYSNWALFFKTQVLGNSSNALLIVVHNRLKAGHYLMDYWNYTKQDFNPAFFTRLRTKFVTRYGTNTCLCGIH